MGALGRPAGEGRAERGQQGRGAGTRARRALWQGSGPEGKGRRWRRPGRRAGRQHSPRAAVAGGRAPSSSSSGSSSTNAGLGVMSASADLGCIQRPVTAWGWGSPRPPALGPGAARTPALDRGDRGAGRPAFPAALRAEEAAAGEPWLSKADKGFTLITDLPRPPSKHRLDSWLL